MINKLIDIAVVFENLLTTTPVYMVVVAHHTSEFPFIHETHEHRYRVII